MLIRTQNHGLKSALIGLGFIAAANSSWGALSQITVSSFTSFTINSAVYDSGSGVANASSGWAGKWIARISGGSVPAGYTLNQNWNGFCTDIGNTMGTGAYNYQASPFSAATDTDDNNGTPPIRSGPLCCPVTKRRGFITSIRQIQAPASPTTSAPGMLP